MKGTKFLLAGMAVMLSSAAIPADDLTSKIGALNTPTVAGELPGLESLQLGRGRMTLSAGTKAYSLTAGDRPCGVWINGPARFTYRVEDPLSVPLAKRNLETGKGLHWRLDGDAVELSIDLQEAVVWSFSGFGEVDVNPEGLTFSPWASTLLESEFLDIPGTEMLVAGAPDLTSSLAWLRGDTQEFQLNVDPFESGLESLYWLRELKGQMWGTFQGEKVPVVQLNQPVGRDWRDTMKPLWTIERLATEVKNPQAERLEISAKFVLRSNRQGQSIWRGYLPSALYDNRRNRHSVDVEHVTIEGSAADFSHRNGELLVDFGRSLALDERVMVELRYVGDIAIRPQNKSYYRLDPGILFPGGVDELAGAFQLTLDVPESLTPMASGREILRQTSGGRTVLRTQSELPGNFPTVVVGDYHLYDVTVGDRSCRVAAHVFKQEKSAQKVGKLVLATQDYLAQLFATDYPYQQLVIVEIDSWGWGQAPDGVIYITNEAFSPIGTALETPGATSIGINARLVHEVAHGWWGGVVLPDSENAWIIEGLAEYSAALAMRNFVGEKGAKEFRTTLQGWFQVAKRIEDGATLHMVSQLSGWDPKAGGDSWRLRYAKAPVVFHAIRQELVRSKGGKEKGDQMFVVFLRALLTHFQAQPLHTQDLVDVINQISGDDWQPWFDKYVYGTELPEIDLDS